MKLSDIKEQYVMSHVQTNKEAGKITFIRYGFQLGALASDRFYLDVITKPGGVQIETKSTYRNNYTGLAMKEFTVAMWEDVYQKSKPGSVAFFALPKSGTSRQAELMIVDDTSKLAELDKAGGEPSFYWDAHYQGGKKI